MMMMMMMVSYCRSARSLHFPKGLIVSSVITTD